MIFFGLLEGPATFYRVDFVRRDVLLLLVGLDSGLARVPLTEQERLVVGAECDFIRVNVPQTLHLGVELSNLFLLLAASTSLKHAPVNDLHLL